MSNLQPTQEDATCKPKAHLLFDATLDSMEDWYGKERTMGQMGFNDAVYNYILTVPGLQGTKRDKVKNALTYLILKYKDDRAALDTSGAAGE